MLDASVAEGLSSHEAGLRVDLKGGVGREERDLIFVHDRAFQLPATRRKPVLGDLGDLGLRKFRSLIAESGEQPEGRTHARDAPQ